VCLSFSCGTLAACGTNKPRSDITEPRVAAGGVSGDILLPDFCIKLLMRPEGRLPPCATRAKRRIAHKTFYVKIGQPHRRCVSGLPRHNTTTVLHKPLAALQRNTA